MLSDMMVGWIGRVDDRLLDAGVYIMENTPPWGGEKISADVIWGKKYEKAKRKRGKM